MKSRTLYCFLIILVFSISTQCIIAEDFDWPRWRGPNGDGISMETDWNPEALASGPKILWNIDVGMGYSNVAIKENRLYTMGFKIPENYVYCLNAETGNEIWRYSYEGRFQEPKSTPVVDENRVYVLSSAGQILCLKTKNGKVVWEKDIKEDFDPRRTNSGWATSPVVVGNLLLLNTNNIEIALDKKTGDFVWSIEDSVPSRSWGSYATTVVRENNGTKTALFLGPSTLNAVDVSTGKKLWSYMHEDTYHPVADPIVLGNDVFISLPEYCVMLDITENGPRELWNNTELNTWSATAVMVGGYLYGMHGPPEFINFLSWDAMLRVDWPIRCIDATTGAVMWEKKVEPFSLMAADNRLIMLALDGTLRIAEAAPSSYNELSRTNVMEDEDKQRIFATPPALYSGKIYCRNFFGDLVCIDVSK